MSSIPERWAKRLVERGYVDRRGTSGAPSLSALADACGTSTTTISNAISGRRETSVEVVDALVRTLGPDVADWLNVRRPREWSPPANASLLTDRQRKAVEELINAMTERQENDRGNTAAKDRAGGSPAPVPDDGKRPLTDDELAARRKRDSEEAARAAEKAARHGKPDPGDEQD